jgi:hypothetical protein
MSAVNAIQAAWNARSNDIMGGLVETDSVRGSPAEPRRAD